MDASTSSLGSVPKSLEQPPEDLLKNKALDEARRELIKDIVKTALFALAGAVLIGLAVASAPVGGALAFGVIAGVCGVITVGGVISIRKRWQELNDLAQ